MDLEAQQTKTRLSFPSDFTARAAEIKKSKANQVKEKASSIYMRQLQLDKMDSSSTKKQRRRLNKTHGGSSSIGKRSVSNRSEQMQNASSLERAKHRSSKKPNFLQIMPNLGRVKASDVEALGRQRLLKLQNRKRAEEEALRLMKDKSDMFDRYLKKPRNSSIGFLALSQLEKRNPAGYVHYREGGSPALDGTDETTLISPPVDGFESMSINSMPKKTLEYASAKPKYGRCTTYKSLRITSKRKKGSKLTNKLNSSKREIYHRDGLKDKSLDM